MTKNVIQLFRIGLLYLPFFSCWVPKVINHQPVLLDRDTTIRGCCYNYFKYKDKFEINFDTSASIGDGIKISLRNIGSKTAMFSQEFYLYDNAKSLAYSPIDQTYQLPIVMALILAGKGGQICYQESINSNKIRTVSLYWVTDFEIFIKSLNGKFVIKDKRYRIQQSNFKIIGLVEIDIEYSPSNQFFIKIKEN
jgi:hypothetical protein